MLACWVDGWFSPLRTDLWFVKPFPAPACSFPQYVSYADILCKTQNTRSNTERESEKLSWGITYMLLPTTYIVWNTPPCPQNSWTAMFVFTVWQEHLFGKMQLSGLLFWNAVQVRRSCHSSQLSAGCGLWVVGPRVTSGAGNLRLCQGKTLALLPPTCYRHHHHPVHCRCHQHTVIFLSMSSNVIHLMYMIKWVRDGQ